jgi:hypothetical protein
MNEQDKRKLAASEIILTVLAVLGVGAVIWVAWG